MHARNRWGPLSLSLLIMALAGAPAHAQFGGLKKLKDKAKEKVEQRIEQKTDQALDKALNSVECAVSDAACIEQAEAEGKPVQLTDDDGKPIEDVGTLKPGQGAWANYDFKPGERILYEDNFMEDEIGDFPRRMEFKSGALELIEWQGGRWLRANQTAKFYVVLPEVLPERFTMEFDFAIPGGEVWIYPTENDRQRLTFNGSYGSAEVNNFNTEVSARGAFGVSNDPNKIRRGRVMGDGKYIKVYVDDRRVLNVPNADLGRSNKIQFYVDATVENPALFGNFRVAAGGRKLYDALNTAGRVATQGIYFDTGSDRVRPESTPTLKEIGQMLAEHPELKLMIEGHTDNVGDAAANQRLSEARAAAVREQLISAFGVDASRLQSSGLGATRPAASNDTAEGRQQNRRVELVRM